MKVKWKNIILVAWSEYLNWLINPKIIVLFTILVPIREMVVIPMLHAAEEMNQPLNILEPCIALMNTGFLVLLMPLTYIVLISSFPTVNDNMLFYITRMGRRNWIIGEMLFAIMSAATFCVVIILTTIAQVSQVSFVANGWSIVVTDYDKIYGVQSASHMADLLPSNLFFQISPYKAFGFSVLLFMLSLLLYSAIFLAGCIHSRRLLSFFILALQIALGSGLCAIKNKFMWFFPTCHSILKTHYQNYFRKYIFSPWLSVILFLGIQVLLAFLICRKSKTANLDMIGGDVRI